jgi:hypothetical protein
MLYVHRDGHKHGMTGGDLAELCGVHGSRNREHLFVPAIRIAPHGSAPRPIALATRFNRVRAGGDQKVAHVGKGLVEAPGALVEV